MEITGYKIERQIGQGGMAQVFLAIQKSLNRPVALKVLRGDFSHSPELSERFLNEGRIVATLNHANIITIHDIGVAYGIHYLSMEYVEGGDLRARIAAGMPPAQALELLRAIGGALHHAHQAGVVHRDVKPGNILFRTDGTPLLTDFGIAKNLQTADDFTMTGGLIGSPHYLSPEQAQGTTVDGRSDIYSLGIIFYNMLVGEKPFEAESPMATIYMHIHEPLPKLPQPLRMYQPLLDRMTAKQPEDRFEDAGRLLSTIDATVGSVADSTTIMLAGGGRHAGTGSMPVPASTSAPTSRWKSKSKSKSADEAEATTRLAPARGWRLPRANWAVLSLGAGVLIAAGAILAGTGLLERDSASGPDARTTTPLASAATAPDTSPPPRSGAPASPASTDSGGREPSPVEPAKPVKPPKPIVTTETKVARLVALGEQALAKNRLTIPRQTSAHHYFRQALALDPSHRGAKRGLDKIANAYLRLARDDLGAGRTSQAIKRVNLGLSVRPGSKQLLELKGRIRRQMEVDRLLARARAALANYRLTTPVRDNAYHYYREVLKLDPRNRAAAAGMGEIARRYAMLAEGHVAEYEYEKAQQYIARGLEVQPRNRRLLELREQARITNAPKQFIGDIKRFFGSD